MLGEVCSNPAAIMLSGASDTHLHIVMPTCPVRVLQTLSTEAQSSDHGHATQLIIHACPSTGWCVCATCTLCELIIVCVCVDKV